LFVIGGIEMKKACISLSIIMVVSFCIYTSAHANWGWECTDDPEPYYYQGWGKWYVYEDTRIFMVQLDEKTYKYVFDYNSNFMGGWVTYMPMRLP
jgi:hypothetical protein